MMCYVVTSMIMFIYQIIQLSHVYLKSLSRNRGIVSSFMIYQKSRNVKLNTVRVYKYDFKHLRLLGPQKQ